MDPIIVATIIGQIISIAGAALASGIVTSLLTQALKWRLIAIPAKKYPVQVATVLSLLVSAGAVFALNVVPLVNVVSYLVFAAATLLVATQSYDIVRKAVDNEKENS